MSVLVPTELAHSVGYLERVEGKYYADCGLVYGKQER